MSREQHNGVDRRYVLRTGLLGALGGLTACEREKTATQEPAIDLESSLDLRALAQFPEKAPLILLTDRPPQLETPLLYFKEDLTPNEAHFVRWHLAGLPTGVDLKTWRLQIAGVVKRSLSISFSELQKFDPISMVALNQCSGNSRSLFAPRVPGGQWRHGAMSNARWTGVRLRDLLAKAGVGGEATEVSFRGLDTAPLAGTPLFEKSLMLDVARSEDVLVAYAMNDKPLPALNGFPVRLVVPGWYATYWVKSLAVITVRKEPLKSFWMDKAYRIPNNQAAAETPAKQATNTVPISKMAVHSIFVEPAPGEPVKLGSAVQVQGLATDNGGGIRRVEVSFDGGKSWTNAKLDPELGRYSWRRWRTGWKPEQKQTCRLMVRATNAAGETQRGDQWNHSGYQRNLIEHLDVRVV